MNRADREHLDRVASLGCCVCLREGHGYTPAEIHHPRSQGSMGKKAPHSSAISLCAPHHRTGGYGIALHAGQKEFERRYGTEAELLAFVREQLGIEP